MNRELDLKTLSKKLSSLRGSFFNVFSIWDKICLDEKSFILQFDLEKIERNTEVKEKIASDLEELSGELNEVLSEICSCYQINLQKITIGSVSGALEEKESLNHENLSLKSIKEYLLDLQDNFNSYYTSLKSNSILIHKLLESHKRSVSFWQEYSAKLAASYDQKGEKRTHKTSSKLSVKA